MSLTVSCLARSIATESRAPIAKLCPSMPNNTNQRGNRANALLVADLGPPQFDEQVMRNTLDRFGLEVSIPEEIAMTQDRLVMLKNDTSQIVFNRDSSFDGSTGAGQFPEQVPVRQAVAVQQYGFNQNERLVFDGVRVATEAGGTTEGSGELVNPYITEATINAQQVMILINAIYFKGQWQKRFDKALTRDEPFYLLSGSPQQTPMMSQSGSYQYFQGDKFQALCLPYGNGSTSLYLFLPEPNSSLPNFLNGFSHEAWEQWMTRFQATPGEIKIPRFKLDYEVNLNETLKALGMDVAFAEGKADFSGMRPQRDLFISEVRHKAVVALNEQGTTAAAATSVGMGVTSVVIPPQTFSFIANHPFLLAIRHQQSGAILFMGVVNEPK